MSEFIPVSEPDLNGNEHKYLKKCIETNWISSIGSFVTEFENRFANYCERKYGVATCNGTVALHLALEALGIGPGDEVIVPSLTFVASASSVVHAGAKPVFADINKDDWNIDCSKIEEKITPRTKAIIIVHLFGCPCNMDQLMKIKEKYHLYLIEDAAQAHGAVYKNHRVGSYGEISCFSFYANKVITTGEGGMCLTNSSGLFETLKQLRDHSMDKEKRYWHNSIGYNYRMTNMQAAVGVAQLERIDELIKKKREIASKYMSYLYGTPLTLQKNSEDVTSIYWLFSVLLPKEIDRDRFIAQLKERNIDSRPFFYPLHVLPPFRKDQATSLPVSEEIGRRGISLPSSTHLKEEQIKYISDAISRMI